MEKGKWNRWVSGLEILKSTWLAMREKFIVLLIFFFVTGGSFCMQTTIESLFDEYEYESKSELEIILWRISLKHFEYQYF